MPADRPGHQRAAQPRTNRPAPQGADRSAEQIEHALLKGATSTGLSGVLNVIELVTERLTRQATTGSISAACEIRWPKV